MTLRHSLIFTVFTAASIAGVAVAAQAGVAGDAGYRDAAAIFGSAIAASVAGFAFSAICGAFLFHAGSVPAHVVQIMVMSSIAIQSLSVAALWRSIVWRSLGRFLCGGVFGLPIGVFLLYRVAPETYLRTIGAFLLGYGAYTLLRRPIVLSVDARWGAAVDSIVGMLGGITGGFAGFPGAFVTIWCSQRGWDKLRQRALYQPYILIMQIGALAALSVRARLPGVHEPLFDVTALAYVPLALAGSYLGLRVFARLSDRQFARFLSLTLIASGIGLIRVR